MFRILLYVLFLIFTQNISGSQHPPKVDHYKITQPYVNGPQKDYRDIRFSPGDTIIVHASGCVQTGGFGLTWKRYVDPQGPNSDHLYHGLISIPGVIKGGFVRIQKIIGRKIYVPRNAKKDSLYLKLGYEDDHYGDNGYWSHDNGTNDQCKGIGDAVVKINVIHSVADSANPGISANRTNFLSQIHNASPIAAWIFGGGLLFVLVIALFNNQPLNRNRRSILRFFMALTAAFFSVFFVGGVILQGNLLGLGIAAGGGVALFILIQFVYDPFRS